MINSYSVVSWFSVALCGKKAFIVAEVSFVIHRQFTEWKFSCGVY